MATTRGAPFLLWDKAIDQFRQDGVIGAGARRLRRARAGTVEQPKDWPKGKPFKPQGWQDAWLNQKITIRPGPRARPRSEEIKAQGGRRRARTARSDA